MNDQRKAFEIWAASTGVVNLLRYTQSVGGIETKGDYRAIGVEGKWKAWQEALRQCASCRNGSLASYAKNELERNQGK